MAPLPARLLSGTAVSAAGRVVGTALSVLTIGVITRSLASTAGVAAYGAYAAIFAFLSAVAIIADGGLYLIFTREAARLGSRDEAALLRRMLWVRLLTFGLVVLGVALLVSVFRYPGVVRHGILLGSVGIGSQLVSQLTLGVFQKRLQMLIPAAAEVIGRGITLGAASLVALRAPGILAYVGAFVAGSFATALCNSFGARHTLRRSLGVPVRSDSGHPELRRGVPGAAASPSTLTLLREAWPLALMLLFSFVVFRADSVLLSYVRPPEDLGWYALPYKILESLLFFPAMIGGLLFPTFSQQAAPALLRRPLPGATTEQFSQTLDASTQLFLILAIPTVLLLYVGAPFLIALLGGPDFAPSVPALRILAVALGALFFGNLYGNSAIALGAQRPLLVAAGFLAVANVAVNLVVIPRFSFLGAAWTTLGTEVCAAFLVVRIVTRRLRTFSLSPRLWHIASAGGVFLAVLFTPLPAAPRAILGLSAYLLTLQLLGVFSLRSVVILLRTPARGDGKT